MTHYDSKHFSPTELGEAIDKLSDADWLKLRNIAKWLSKKCGALYEDILHESFTRTLSGDRRCPRNIDLVKFLAETMKSIASSDAKSYSRHPEFSLQTPIGHNGSDYQESLAAPKRLTTEDVAIARMDLVKVLEVVPELFESDSESIQCLAMGILDGMDASELQEFSGLHGKEYNSARRLFRRRVEKAFPGGMR